MALLPYMPWYPEAFNSSQDVLTMRPMEELIYRRLLDALWVAGPEGLPGDIPRLSRILRADPRTLRSALDRLKIRLRSLEDRLYMRRILVDMDAAIMRLRGPKPTGLKAAQAKLRAVLADLDAKGRVPELAPPNYPSNNHSSEVVRCPSLGASSSSSSSSRSIDPPPTRALDGARARARATKDEEGVYQPLRGGEEEKTGELSAEQVVARLAGILARRGKVSEADWANTVATWCSLQRSRRVRDPWGALEHRIAEGRLADYSDADEERSRSLLRRAGAITFAAARKEVLGDQKSCSEGAAPAGSNPAGVLCKGE